MYGSQATSIVCNVQQILVVAFKFTSLARGFMINFLYGLWGQIGWTALPYIVTVRQTHKMSSSFYKAVCKSKTVCN